MTEDKKKFVCPLCDIDSNISREDAFQMFREGKLLFMNCKYCNNTMSNKRLKRYLIEYNNKPIEKKPDINNIVINNDIETRIFLYLNDKKW
jgi:TATA-box binding protein (TBP) (component of TFIID and TFIIIB)